MPTDHFHLARLRTAVKPFRLHWFSRLRSTNDHAAALRKRGDLFAPAIVLTGHQIAGRGRGSNSWWSGAGCLTVTFVLPIDEQLAPHQLPLIAGLAVRNAAAELTASQEVMLKWPNDLTYGGRKLAGLLCERINKADLIGLGLNVNINPARAPAALRDQITSLSKIAKENFDMTEALIAVTSHLRRALFRRADQPFVEILRQYDEHNALLGKRIAVQEAGSDRLLTGRCEGLDRTGRLLLRERKALHHIIAGNVQRI